MQTIEVALQVLGDIADIDADTAKLLATVLQPFLSISILLMIIRIVLSWYPQVKPHVRNTDSPLMYFVRDIS